MMQEKRLLVIPNKSHENFSEVKLNVNDLWYIAVLAEIYMCVHAGMRACTYVCMQN